MVETDAVIVGGGIGGAVLALALSRGGRSSVILEREPAPPAAPRPEILWPATFATFDRLGVGDALRASAALPLAGVELSVARDDGRVERLLSMGDELPGAARFRRWSTDAARTRGLLLAAASATGRVTVLRGVEAREIVATRDGAIVRGTESVEVRGAVVVGDDGSQSRVREALGIGLTAKLFPLEFVCAVAPGAAFLGGVARGCLHPAGLDGGVVGAFLVPLPGDRVAIVLPSAFDAFDRLAAGGHAAFAAAFARTVPFARHLAEAVTFPRDFVRARRPVGHADRYVADRAAILGDAAHPVSPAGGQGANMAVADAAALAEVLLARLGTGDLGAEDLAPYERARRPANERSIAFSRRASRIIVAARRFPVLLGLLGPVARTVARSRGAKDRVLRALATSFVGDPVEL